MNLTNYTHIIAMDEVGRGPLAGPVTVGVCVVPMQKYLNVCQRLLGIKDSKKLSEKKRIAWVVVFEKLMKEGVLYAGAVSSSSQVIDQVGINPATAHASSRLVRQVVDGLLKKNKQVVPLLITDARLPLFKKWSEIRTEIIKGDDKDELISAAAIYAKQHRDALMKDLSKEYPEYGFENHVGYGTKAHSAAIKKYGLVNIHRKSFCKRFL